MADIKLLFGVLGGGSITGGSGKEIAKDLGEIVSQINKNPLKIKFDADENSLESLKSRVQEITSSLGSVGAIKLESADFTRMANSIEKIANLFDKDLGGALSKTDVWMDEISKSLSGIKTASDMVTKALPGIALKMAEISRTSSTNLSSVEGELRSIYELLGLISEKEFNVSNFFDYSNNNSIDERIELVRAQALELLTIYNTLQAQTDEIYRGHNRAFNAAMSDRSILNGYERIQQRPLDASALRESIAGADNLSSLNLIIEQMSSRNEIYSRIIDIARTHGITLPAPDMSGYEHATTVLENFLARNEQLQEAIVNNASAIAGNVQPEDTDMISVDTAGQLQRINEMYAEVNNLLDNLRGKIESTFDLTTLTLDTSKIKTVVEQIQQEFDSLELKISAKTDGADGSSGVSGGGSGKSGGGRKKKSDGSSGGSSNSGKAVKLEDAQKLANKIKDTLSKNTNAKVIDEYAALDDDLQSINSKINDAINSGKQFNDVLENLSTSDLERIEGLLDRLVYKMKQAGKTGNPAGAPKIMDGTDLESYRQKIERFKQRIEKDISNYSAARTGDMADNYKVLLDTVSSLDDLANSLNGKTKEQADELFEKIETGALEAEGAIKKSDKATKSWSDRFGSLTKKFTEWFGAAQIVSAIWRAMQRMVTSVIELDTAMTELRKVTNETEATYERFLVNAAARAKSLGAALTDTVTATADFARLGYDISEAEKMADAAIIYKNVGDGIQDINQASESIIATMQAFGVEADDVMTIVDKFNTIGRILPIYTVMC